MPPGVTMDSFGAFDPNLQVIEDGFMQNVQTHFKKFLDIWQQFGLGEDCISSRSTELWGHLRMLMDQMYEEDYASYQKVQKRIRATATTVQGLANLLQVDAKSFDGPLFKKEKALQEELQLLTRLKRERIETYSLLRSEDAECRRAMVMEPSDVVLHAKVPSETDIQRLKEQVGALKSEKERRQAKFRAAREELSSIASNTEWVPQSAFERKLLSEKEGEVLVSKEAMDLVENILSRARLWREELDGRKQGLEDKLRRMWATLKVDERKREEFLAAHQDCHLQTLRSMEAEVKRMEAIRAKRIKPLVKELRRELEDLWDKCYVSQSLRRQDSFSEVTGEVLDLHEEEVARWRGYYERTRPILEKIGKRQGLWDKMIAFETNASNPDRFKNRRGNLLKEERDRKQLQKELPSLENEIFKDIEEYELRCGVPFLYYGEEYTEFVSNQWAQRLNQKEFEKQERRKQRSLESTAVTTPTQKRPRSSGSSPRKALRSSGSSNQCTPLRSQTPNTKIRSQTPNLLNTKIVGRLFSPRSSAQKEDREPRPVESSCNGTTYSVFVDNLNGSNFHSSALEKNSKRGKRGKKGSFSRKSARKVPEATTKLTPKRGKLGLPFLI